MTEPAGTAQVTPNADEGNQTPEQLHDAAITAIEAYQASPDDELKETAKTATQKAKDANVKAKEAAVKTQKETEAAALKNKPPDTYDLKLQEENSLPQECVEKIVSFAKERGFSNENAQDATNLVEDAVLDYKEVQQAALKEQTDVEWPKLVKEDKEIGGEGLKENVELAKRALEQWASKELRTLLKDTGLGNHVEVVRVFSRIGKAMKDDSLVLGGVNQGKEKDIAEVFYGNSKK